jgi:hypothetical protein
MRLLRWVKGLLIPKQFCYVMGMMYEVDLILGEEFLDKYDCILHYGKGCIMIPAGWSANRA